MADLLFSPTSLPVLEQGVPTRPRCSLCRLDRTCASPKMPTSGKGRKKILIVAEAPGKDEDDQGKQLVGKSGRELEKKLYSLGINMREDCWLENALICRPPDNKIKDPKAVEYCRPNIVNRIRELEPEKIILLGGVSAESVLGWVTGEHPGAVERWGGYQIPCQDPNAWIVPTWHPSFILREKDNNKTSVVELKWTEHLRAALELKGRPWKTVPDYASQIEVIFDTREAARRLDTIKSGTIAFDYETNCLKPDSAKAQIYSCSVCYEGRWTVAFPWDHVAARAMVRVLSSKRVRKIAANAKFEDRWTRAKLGTEVKGWVWDTMLTAHALENGTKVRAIAGLGFQAFVHFGIRDWSGKVHPYLKTSGGGGNAINRIHLVGKQELLQYNGMDSLVEYLLAVKQMREMGYG